MSDSHAVLNDMEQKAVVPRFGEAFRQRRMSVGYSIDEVAIITGLTTTEIRAVECGTVVNSGRTARLKRVFGRSQ